MIFSVNNPAIKMKQSMHAKNCARKDHYGNPLAEAQPLLYKKFDFIKTWNASNVLQFSSAATGSQMNDNSLMASVHENDSFA